MFSVVADKIDGIDAAMMAALLLIPFIVTLLLVPWLVIRMPADYFSPEKRRAPVFATTHPVLRVVALALKNLLGILIIVTGTAMLVLPGQGLLTILIGLLLMDFPGKFELERWLVSRKPVLKSINWLRGKRGKKALIIDA